MKRGRPSAAAASVGRDLMRLGRRLGYEFQDWSLLELALTHRSLASNGRASNERLELIGDAVLGLVVADVVFHQLPDAPEGRLTRVRARFVNNEHLAKVARDSGAGSCLRLGKGEAREGGRRKTNALAGAMEAVLGAAFLDGGLEAARRIAGRWIVPDQISDRHDAGALPEDSKTALQEWLQARGRTTPQYAVVSKSGPLHRPTFTVKVRCGQCAATGSAGSKKRAEQKAAASVLEQLVTEERPHRPDRSVAAE